MAHSLAMPFNSVSNLWRRYECHVAKRPLLVNMATSACLWAAGDLFAQRLQRQQNPLDAGLRKTALTAAFGGLVFGPMGYAWYTWLDAAASVLGPANSVKVILAKVLADNTVWSAVYVGLFMTFSSMVISRSSWHEAKEKLGQDFLPTMAVYMVVWPPIMAMVFLRVPLRHQLLSVNLLTVADAGFLSWIDNHSFDELTSAAKIAVTGIDDNEGDESGGSTLSESNVGGKPTRKE
ncbi:hypothetical protein CEUSTIGMA_g8002.t1 [Chlamydomonas eustigma]|uniref:Uncharacterized protein n=1 Tax=Chlamydomonas eustigma TaxID=1157962 RepID=A0A250XBW0_9CHLO|nr:hypothetical protein CEUSTIGMA_g8002.t1 [Chlamydomonas eustigma]|eukprot:GAX80565.1 hypothetical protein CEUSTIGMA_g8002.t1 [Chlamydomonas eustigma]